MNERLKDFLDGAGNIPMIAVYMAISLLAVAVFSGCGMYDANLDPIPQVDPATGQTYTPRPLEEHINQIGVQLSPLTGGISMLIAGLAGTSITWYRQLRKLRQAAREIDLNPNTPPIRKQVTSAVGLDAVNKVVGGERVNE